MRTQQKLKTKPSRFEVMNKAIRNDTVSVLEGPFSHSDGYRTVPINKIVEDPENERKTYRDLADLVESVLKVGIVQPLIVTPCSDGKFKILAGSRRFRAAQAAKLKTIGVLVEQEESEFKRRQKSLITNLHREDVPIFELADSLRTLLDDNPNIKSQRELASEIGKPERWVSEVLKVLSLCKAAREKLRISEVFVANDSIMRIAREQDPKFQVELVTSAIKGAAPEAIRAKINNRKQSEGRGGVRKNRSTTRNFVLKNGRVSVISSKSKPTKADYRRLLEAAIKELG